MTLVHHRGGSGEPLVLLHGIGSRWQMWEPVLGRLEAERDVIAIDLPGFGASPPPPHGTPAGVEPLTLLIAQFLDELGLDRPHVAGNSLGGWLSLELGRRRRARSVTVLSPAGFQTPAEARFSRASLWLTVRAARLMAPRADRLMSTGARRRLAFSQVVAHPERMSAHDAAESVRALAGAPWFDATLPSVASERHFSGGRELEVPVTVAWGERDHLLLPGQARRAAVAIPSARIVMLPGCGHVPTYDDPDQVAQVLLDGSRGS